MSGNIIVILIVTAILAGAIAKIIIDKKNGVKCSGCPHSKTCSNKSISNDHCISGSHADCQSVKCEDMQNSRAI